MINDDQTIRDITGHIDDIYAKLQFIYDNEMIKTLEDIYKEYNSWDKMTDLWSTLAMKLCFYYTIDVEISINPYSVLTPPGGVLGLLKIIHFTNIFLFIACKIRKYLIFTRKTRNMSDAVRVKLARLVYNTWTIKTKSIYNQSFYLWKFEENKYLNKQKLIENIIVKLKSEYIGIARILEYIYFNETIKYKFRKYYETLDDDVSERLDEYKKINEEKRAEEKIALDEENAKRIKASQKEKELNEQKARERLQTLEEQETGTRIKYQIGEYDYGYYNEDTGKEWID